jgi:hypothetical protein
VSASWSQEGVGRDRLRSTAGIIAQKECGQEKNSANLKRLRNQMISKKLKKSKNSNDFNFPTSWKDLSTD